MFEGFSQETVNFLWGIRFNNERSWFLDHKEDFRNHVDLPLRQLAQQVSQVMDEEFPELGLQLKVSRIYRDARRLFGRGPYKDHLWFSLRLPSGEDSATPCIFFELAPECWRTGMSCYDPKPITMMKLRARIDRDPKPLTKLVRGLEKRPEFRLETQPYKRPKGDPGELLRPWYNSRQISVERAENCEGDYLTSDLFDRVVEDFRFLVPVYRYMRSLASDPDPRDPV